MMEEIENDFFSSLFYRVDAMPCRAARALVLFSTSLLTLTKEKSGRWQTDESFSEAGLS